VIKAWQTIKDKELLVADPWIRVSRQEVLLPDGRIISDYYQVKMQEFVTIVALTPEGKVITTWQYKHGIGKASVAVPGGFIKPGEEPLAAAKRELREETGCEADEWASLGAYVCNASYGCGKAHYFLAWGARKVGEPIPDDLEEMEFHLLDPEEIFKAISDGRVVAMGAVLAFAMAFNPKISGHGGKR